MPVSVAFQPRPLVVVLVLSGLLLHHFGTRFTPELVELARRGGVRPDGGRAVLAVSTFPNMLTLATGTGPARHGVYADHIIIDGVARPAWSLPSSVPTLFDACRQAGRGSVAVLGDGRLVPLWEWSKPPPTGPPRVASRRAHVSSAAMFQADLPATVVHLRSD